MCLYLQKVKEVVADEVVDINPCLIVTNYADKDDYLFNARSVLSNYKPYLIGMSGKKLDKEQLRAMACMLNATGLWSEYWARHLTDVPFLQEPYEPPVKATVSQ